MAANMSMKNLPFNASRTHDSEVPPFKFFFMFFEVCIPMLIFGCLANADLENFIMLLLCLDSSTANEWGRVLFFKRELSRRFLTSKLFI